MYFVKVWGKRLQNLLWFCTNKISKQNICFSSSMLLKLVTIICPSVHVLIEVMSEEICTFVVITICLAVHVFIAIMSEELDPFVVILHC